ncbi:MAG: peptidylprolyl isomerase [Bacilli bacterium]|nr:peptidylprolyl isomerase [Bacilli bacterium]
MNKKLLIGLSALLIFTGCGTATLKNGKQVVAKMKGKTITAEDLYGELKNQGGASTLTNMIDDYVVNKAIKTDDDAKNYAESQIKQYKESYENYGMNFTEALVNAGYKSEAAFKEVLILDYKKKEVTKKYVKKGITNDEINEYYKENIYGDIEARHILISPNTKDGMTDEEKDEAENKAKKEAEKIIKKLDKGEKFSTLAKKYSDDKGTASNGGKLTVTYGAVVDEFWEGTISLKDGEYSKEPVKSQYGYHIIYRIKQKDKPKLSKVKDTIIDEIVSKKTEDDSTLQTKALVELREKYNLKISDSSLKKSYDASVKSALSSSNEKSSE